MTIVIPEQPPEAPPDAPLASDYIDIDLSLQTSFDAGIPHDAFAELRHHAPVAWHTETAPPAIAGQVFGMYTAGPGFWAVTSHAGVTEVSRSPERFSSALGATMIPTPPPPALMLSRQMMLNMDPPQHSRLRRILQPVFAPRAVQKLHGAVARNAAEIIDEIASAGGCDLVPAVSEEITVRVLADLLGMPRSDRHLIFEWSNRLIGAEDPEYGGDLAVTGTAAMELFQYGTAMAADRRANPRDDIVSMIANAEVDGERLTDIEFAMFWLLLIVAGNETTRNALSGAVVALHEHGLWDWLRDHPEAMGTAVEELVRYVSPVIHFRRTATEDTELCGQRIRAGDKVVVYYSSANRDEEAFDNPNGLDLTRDPNPHLGYGIGPHFCLGVHVARAELNVMLGELLTRLPDLEPVGPAERVRSYFINGIKHLPVRYSAAA